MLTKEDIVKLLSEEITQEELFQQADSIRRQYVGDEVHLRGLIEFSNICRNNCMYCGIRCGNHKATRYRMDEDEIIFTVHNAINNGFKTIVMQSGEDVYFTTDKMCRIIDAIKKYDVALTLSIGERSYEDYKAFKNAGADRYLMRIETTDKELYKKLHPNMSWQQRYECLLALKELGYELGSGIIVGLPEQTMQSIAQDLLFLKDLDIDMAGIGPFIPHQDTPLANEKGGNIYLSIRAMAIMRILLPDINIPATTAMEVLHPQGRIIALQAGANVIMHNITTSNYRILYELYPNKEKANETYSVFINKLHCISRTVSDTHGEHKKIA